ncbi:MAG: hypothetical protein Q9217_003663 [Psora testacea]
MQWTEAEEALLLRTREAHPDASWKYVAQHYNAQVSQDRQRSHWSLTWKYRDLVALATLDEQNDKNDNTGKGQSAHSMSPTTQQHLNQRNSTTSKKGLPASDLDFNASLGSASTLRRQQQMAQQIRQQNANAPKPPYSTLEPVTHGFNSVQANNTIPTLLPRFQPQLQPQPNFGAPYATANNVNFVGSSNSNFEGGNFTRNAGENKQRVVLPPPAAHQQYAYAYTGQASEYGPGWREMPNAAAGYAEDAWQDGHVTGQFMGYPPSA